MLAVIATAVLLATAGPPEKYFPQDYPKAASARRRQIRSASTRYRWPRSGDPLAGAGARLKEQRR